MTEMGREEGLSLNPSSSKSQGRLPVGHQTKRKGAREGGDNGAHRVKSWKDQGPQLPRDSLPSPFTSQALPPQGENLLQIRLLQKIF